MDGRPAARLGLLGAPTWVDFGRMVRILKVKVMASLEIFRESRQADLGRLNDAVGSTDE